jgi:hypothetical protein
VSPNLAPVTSAEHGPVHAGANQGSHEGATGSPSSHQVDQESLRVGRWVWVTMMIGIGVEFVTGVVTLVVVPLGRPDGWLPNRGEVAYVIHASLGGALTLAAMCLVLVAPRQRIGRAGVLIGLAGLAVAATGGIVAAYHPSRFVGLLLMLVGTFVAFLGYLMPLADPVVRTEAE